MKRVVAIRRAADPAPHTITLAYDARLLRRRRLVTDDGTAILVDLAQTTDLQDGDALELEDGSRVTVRARDEPLLEVGGDLPRLAWHIGNRHTPCEIRNDRLVIRADHVLADMLLRLGASVNEAVGPFRPEGGAYGHGRTLPHDHAPLSAGPEGHHHAHDAHGHSHADADASPS